MSKGPTHVMIGAYLTLVPAKADCAAIGAVVGGAMGELAHHEVKRRIEQRRSPVRPLAAAWAPKR